MERYQSWPPELTAHMIRPMSGDAEETQLIIYPGEVDRSITPRMWSRFGWLVTVVVLTTAGGYVLAQESESPRPELQCDEVRSLTRNAELAAIDTLATRNELIKELDDRPQFMTPSYIERGDQLRRQVMAQESRVLIAYSGWEDALNLNRECFGSPDLSFARTRIRMVRVMFG